MKNRINHIASHRFAPLAAFVILALTATYIYTKQYDHIRSNIHQVQKLEQTQQESLYSSCHRLNLLRAADNRSQYADFKFFTLTTRLLAKSLTHPLPGRNISPQERKITLAYIRSLKSSAKDKQWIRLTHCTPATVSPKRIITYKAIQFSKKIPPRSVYHVGPGE